MRFTVHEEGVRSEVSFERDSAVLGRNVDCDLRLANTRVSRRHARFERAGERVFVIDLQSANGSWVNGERIARRELFVGDEVLVGAVRLVYEGLARPPASDTQALDLEEAGYRTSLPELDDERVALHGYSRLCAQLLAPHDTPTLLRAIIDSALELVRAERGFLLLSPEPGEKPQYGGWALKVARSHERLDVPLPHTRLSQGVVKKVHEAGASLLSIDAGRDERLSGMASVEDLRLRSVVCVPIRIEGRAEGVLYVDHRLQEGAFDERDLEALELYASLAGLAILSRRRVEELERRNAELEEARTRVARLVDELGRKVRDRDGELAVVRAELARERGRHDYAAIVGRSDAMKHVFQLLDRFIESDLPVLVSGESGTGKELVARAIHKNGPRKDKPFVGENCAALPDALLESELFGHAKGAFTGAHRHKRGLLEAADGGTLFLDEIGDMSPEMQKKLLRVLQEGEFRPVGSDVVQKVDVRLVAASHKDLAALVREGRFREDLYYRVHVLHVRLPALRERREDLPLLAQHLLVRAAREAGRPAPDLSQEVLAAICAHDWPGNVRELENELRRAVVLAGDELRLEHLSSDVLERRGVRMGVDGGVEGGVDMKSAVADLERRSIEAALLAAAGNKSRAAGELGISRFALQRKLDKYGLDAGRRDGTGDEPAVEG
jgi:transcriptional regulator with GAF, ATPase, and Fis domain